MGSMGAGMPSQPPVTMHSFIGDYFVDMGGGQVLEVRIADGGLFAEAYNKSAGGRDKLGELVADVASGSVGAFTVKGDEIISFTLSNGLATSVTMYGMTLDYIDGSREMAAEGA